MTQILLEFTQIPIEMTQIRGRNDPSFPAIEPGFRRNDTNTHRLSEKDFAHPL